jgi:tRNA U55 pseudouridine synthase TruB
MTVSALRRLKCGPFGIEEAVTLSDFIEEGKRGEASRRLVPIGKALAGFPHREIPSEAVAAVRHGGSPGPWLDDRDAGLGAGAILLTHGKEGPIALVERQASGQWRILRGI